MDLDADVFRSLCLGALVLIGVSAVPPPPGDHSPPLSTDQMQRSKVFGVVELRRYTVKPGERDRFARYFETFFPEALEAFARRAEETFAGYRAAGIREASVLVTLEAPDNFPQLRIRADGPFLVWIGLMADNQALETRFMPLSERAGPFLSATGLLRAAPELVILDPTRRSRLRWLPEWRK